MKGKSGNEKDLDPISEHESPKEFGSQSVDQGRRRFAKAGVAAPVLMSVFSRPVWSFECTISGLNSGNVSDHPHDDCEGVGCTPGFWAQNLSAWGCTGLSPGECADGSSASGSGCKEWSMEGATSFQSVFGFPPPEVGATSLLGVMLNHEVLGSEGTYYFHLIAALLNSLCSTAYGATPADVIELAHNVEDNKYDGGSRYYYLNVSETLDYMNNRGCFLNSHGICKEKYVIPEDRCIPVCESGYYFDFIDEICKPGIRPPE